MSAAINCMTAVSLVAVIMHFDRSESVTVVSEISAVRLVNRLPNLLHRA